MNNHMMGSAEEVATKRYRLLGIYDLSDDVIGMIFKFFWARHFLFVAGTR